MSWRPTPKQAVLLLLALSAAVHFAWFGHPDTTVFDEVHFGKFLSAYFTHEYYFDIHPPLGKLILAGWGWLWGFQPGFSFANIGDAFPDHTYLALRLLPTLAGTLLPLIIYGVARQLGMRRPAALLAGTLVALDNALLVQSRLILLDPFLLLFGFGALWSYLRYRKGGHPALLAAAGALGAMSMSIKWTGAAFLGIIVVLEMVHLWEQRATKSWRHAGPALAALVVIPALIYYSVFMVHFALLNKTGTGDAFMSPEFQHDLAGNPNGEDATLQKLSATEKFAQLNIEMYRSNQRLTAGHPYSSPWYTWPLMVRPIFYWVEGTARIYLMGNPVVWWASSAAVLTILAGILMAGIRATERSVRIMAGSWLINMLPFIGISRVMFLYHYFAGLIWAILMLAWLVDRGPRPARTALALGGLALVAFLFFAPLSYGLGMSEGAYNLRVWLSSWR